MPLSFTHGSLVRAEPVEGDGGSPGLVGGAGFRRVHGRRGRLQRRMASSALPSRRLRKSRRAYAVESPGDWQFRVLGDLRQRIGGHTLYRAQMYVV